VGENKGSIEESYAAEKVNSGAEAIGGLIGTNTAAVSKSYYDSDKTGQHDTDKGESLTTAQMKQQASFDGCDFDSVWTIAEGSEYPTLKWQTGP
jgi:hypothetical protein